MKKEGVQIVVHPLFLWRWCLGPKSYIEDFVKTPT